MSVPKMYGVNLTDNDDDFDGNKDYCNTCGEECCEFEPHECSELVARLQKQIEKMKNQFNCKNKMDEHMSVCFLNKECPCNEWRMKE